MLHNCELVITGRRHIKNNTNFVALYLKNLKKNVLISVAIVLKAIVLVR